MPTISKDFKSNVSGRSQVRRCSGRRGRKCSIRKRSALEIFMIKAKPMLVLGERGDR
jgi:hypothetical protein